VKSASPTGQDADHDPAGDHGAHGDFKPHESPPAMAYPLVVLAVLAAIGGILKSPLDRWLEPVVGERLHHVVAGTGTKTGLMALTTAGALAGIAIAFAIYLRHRVKESSVEPLVLRRAWYVDDFYRVAVEGPSRVIANFSAFFIDAKVIDGTVNGVGTLVRAGGGRLRRVQTGFVRNYALAVAAGAVAILAYMVARTV
jgi:NADH-quinone oxidoreductase subunit L